MFSSIFGSGNSGEREVDKRDAKREIPMRVICLGFSRTGTFSLYTALQKLGFTPYHGIEAIKNPWRDYPLWAEAINDTFVTKERPWGRAEFDKLLGKYDATIDHPSFMFKKELLEAYPDAKVILTSRPLEAWMKSMKQTVGACHNWWSWRIVCQFEDTIGRPWWQFHKTLKHVGEAPDFELDGPRAKNYLAHLEWVRNNVPKERLLDFDPKMGWEPLCEHLGVPVPTDGPYPHVNDSEGFIEGNKKLWWLCAIAMIRKLTIASVALGGASYYGWLWYMDKPMPKLPLLN